jgi:hypothetical protein
VPAGDSIILREAAGGDTDNSTTYSLFTFDTTVHEDTATFNRVSIPTDAVEVNEAGHYLCLYNLGYVGTGSNRSELTARVAINNVATEPYGWSTGYIRRSGDFESAQCAGTILELSATDEVSIEKARTDSNTGGATCTQVADESGLALIRLDDDLNYCRLRDTTTQSLTHASGELPPVTGASFEWQDVQFRIQDEIDSGATGYSHSTTVNPAEITLIDRKRYLVCYQVKFNNTSASVRVNGMARLSWNGSVVPGSYSTAYCRGSNGVQDGIASGMAIVFATASSRVLKVEAACDQESTGTLDIASAAITIVELGNWTETAKLRQSADHDHNTTTFDPIEFDTQDWIDSAYTHSTSVNPSRVTPSNEGRHLAITTFLQVRTGLNATRKRPRAQYRLDGSTVIPYGMADNQNRGDQGTTGTWTAGASAAVVIDYGVSNSYFEAGGLAMNTTADSATAWAAGDTALYLVDVGTLERPGAIEGTTQGAATVPAATASSIGALVSTVQAEAIIGKSELIGFAAISATLTASSVLPAGTMVNATPIGLIKPIAGTLQGAASTSGALLGTGELDASAAGTSLVAGDLGALASLEGSASGAATLSGSLAAIGSISSSAQGSSTASGVLLGFAGLAGSAQGVAAVSGILAASGASSATASGASTVSGLLTGSGSLSALAQGAASLAGSLTAGPSIGSISGTIRTGTIPLSGILVGFGTLSASSQGEATASATALASGILEATSSGAATSAATLAAFGELAATVQGFATASASFAAAGDIEGTSQGAAIASGALLALASSSGAVQGSATVSGSLGASGVLSGSSAGSATASGILAGTALIAGTVTGSATASAAPNGIGALSDRVRAGAIVPAAELVGTAIIGGQVFGLATVGTTTLIASGDLAAIAFGSATVSASITFAEFEGLEVRLDGTATYDALLAGAATYQAQHPGSGSYTSTVSGSASYDATRDGSASYISQHSGDGSL